MTGVLLSGGGFCGAFQAGAIQRLHEEGIRPDVGYGISVGSLNLAMWMQGDADKLFELWSRIRFEDVFSKRMNLLSAYRKGGLHSNAPLKKLIDRYVDPNRIRGRYYAGLVDLTSHTYVAASKLNGWHDALRTAILGSTSVPVQHTPVKYGGHTWVDGGVWSVSPMGHLLDLMNHGADRVIVVNCAPEHLPENARHSVKNILDVAQESVSLMVDKSVVQDLKAFRAINELCRKAGGTVPRDNGGVYKHVPAIIVQPDHHLGSGMDADRDRLNALYLMGYEAASKALSVYAEAA